MKISLNSQMTANLLSLQSTQKLMDKVQLKLSTGLKVSSVMENPNAFYTAESLNNRAQNLSSLLDSMTQSVQTIKATSEALKTGAALLEQSSSVAAQAISRTVSGSENITPIPDPTPDFSNYTKVTSVDELKAALGDASVDKIVIMNDLTFADDEVIRIGADKLIEGKSNDVKLTFNNTLLKKNQFPLVLADNAILKNLSFDMTFPSSTASGAVIKGGLLEGEINIVTCGERASGIDGSIINGTVNITTSGLNAVGIYKGTLNGTANITTTGPTGYGIVGGTIKGTANIVTNGYDADAVYECQAINGTVNIKTTGDKSEGVTKGIINGTVNILTTGNGSWGVYRSTINGTANIYVSGPASRALSDSTITDTGMVKAVSETADAAWNFTTNEIGAELWVSSRGADILSQWKVSDSSGLVSTGKTSSTADFIALLQKDVDNALNNVSASPVLLSDEAEYIEKDIVYDLRGYAKQYNSIISQYNNLIKDSSYKGINLLNLDKLTTDFNEDHSSKLEIYGVDASSKALGLNEAIWATFDDIRISIDEIRGAVSQLRNFSAQFGNYYSIVSNRQDFTERLINVLEEGANLLTLADMNEESANMLALQTRQQLAVNSLSLASQASQGVLKLF